MMRAWFVTAVMHPEVPLDGPFECRDDCEVRCVVRADTWSTLRAVADGRLLSHYVPHQFETRVEVPHLYSHAETLRVPPPKTPDGLLPPIVYTYTRGGLLVLCRALGLDQPPDGVDRARIIIHMETQLRMLAKA